MFSKLVQASLLLSGVAPVLAGPVPAKIVSRAAAVDELVGFGAGTTGGGSGEGTTVTTCAELTTALETGGVIYIDGQLSDCGVLEVPSDTSVLGIGENSGLTGGGFKVKKANNVIFRNLALSKAPSGEDLIGIETSTQVWVDHCDFSSVGLEGDKDEYDGLLDIKRAADKITVSWNKFHDHWKASLIGHSDSNSEQDEGTLHVTYHHNDWSNINSRTPSIRFGTLHVYSSCYTDIPTSGIHPRMGAQALVEQNYFSNVTRAIVTSLDSEVDGFANDVDNIFEDSDISISQVGTFTEPEYEYTTDEASQICEIVGNSAGTGVIDV